MLNEREKEFLGYWEENRHRRKNWVRSLSVGLPLAVVLVVAIFINFFSGWYTRASMLFNAGNGSLVLVLTFAAVLIACFIVIFSARHSWDQKEQHYRELKEKEKD